MASSVRPATQRQQPALADQHRPGPLADAVGREGRLDPGDARLGRPGLGVEVGEGARDEGRGVGVG